MSLSFPEFSKLFSLVNTGKVKYGSFSLETKYVQDLLKKGGYYPSNLPSTGYYGKETQKAFSKIWSDPNYLDYKNWNKTVFGPKGTVETKTQKEQFEATFESLFKDAPALKGKTSDQVKSYQDLLKQKGYFPSNVASTGYWGDITEQAYRKALADYQGITNQYNQAKSQALQLQTSSTKVTAQEILAKNQAQQQLLAEQEAKKRAAEEEALRRAEEERKRREFEAKVKDLENRGLALVQKFGGAFKDKALSIVNDLVNKAKTTGAFEDVETIIKKAFTDELNSHIQKFLPSNLRKDVIRDKAEKLGEDLVRSGKFVPSPSEVAKELGAEIVKKVTSTGQKATETVGKIEKKLEETQQKIVEKKEEVQQKVQEKFEEAGRKMVESEKFVKTPEEAAKEVKEKIGEKSEDIKIKIKEVVSKIPKDALQASVSSHVDKDKLKETIEKDKGSLVNKNLNTPNITDKGFFKEMGKECYVPPDELLRMKKEREENPSLWNKLSRSLGMTARNFVDLIKSHPAKLLGEEIGDLLIFSNWITIRKLSKEEEENLFNLPSFNVPEPLKPINKEIPVFKIELSPNIGQTVHKLKTDVVAIFTGKFFARKQYGLNLETGEPEFSYIPESLKDTEEYIKIKEKIKISDAQRVIEKIEKGEYVSQDELAEAWGGIELISKQMNDLMEKAKESGVVFEYEISDGKEIPVGVSEEWLSSNKILELIGPISDPLLDQASKNIARMNDLVKEKATLLQGEVGELINYLSDPKKYDLSEFKDLEEKLAKNYGSLKTISSLQSQLTELSDFINDNSEFLSKSQDLFAEYQSIVNTMQGLTTPEIEEYTKLVQNINNLNSSQLLQLNTLYIRNKKTIDQLSSLSTRLNEIVSFLNANKAKLDNVNQKYNLYQTLVNQLNNIMTPELTSLIQQISNPEVISKIENVNKILPKLEANQGKIDKLIAIENEYQELYNWFEKNSNEIQKRAVEQNDKAYAKLQAYFNSTIQPIFNKLESLTKQAEKWEKVLEEGIGKLKIYQSQELGYEMAKIYSKPLTWTNLISQFIGKTVPFYIQHKELNPKTGDIEYKGMLPKVVDSVKNVISVYLDYYDKIVVHKIVPTYQATASAVSDWLYCTTTKETADYLTKNGKLMPNIIFDQLNTLQQQVNAVKGVMYTPITREQWDNASFFEKYAKSWEIYSKQPEIKLSNMLLPQDKAKVKNFIKTKIGNIAPFEDVDQIGEQIFKVADDFGMFAFDPLNLVAPAWILGSVKNVYMNILRMPPIRNITNILKKTEAGRIMMNLEKGIAEVAKFFGGGLLDPKYIKFYDNYIPDFVKIRDAFFGMKLFRSLPAHLAKFEWKTESSLKNISQLSELKVIKAIDNYYYKDIKDIPLVIDHITPLPEQKLVKAIVLTKDDLGSLSHKLYKKENQRKILDHQLRGLFFDNKIAPEQRFFAFFNSIGIPLVEGEHIALNSKDMIKGLSLILERQQTVQNFTKTFNRRFNKEYNSLTPFGKAFYDSLYSFKNDKVRNELIDYYSKAFARDKKTASQLIKAAKLFKKDLDELKIFREEASKINLEVSLPANWKIARDEHLLGKETIKLLTDGSEASKLFIYNPSEVLGPEEILHDFFKNLVDAKINDLEDIKPLLVEKAIFEKKYLGAGEVFETKLGGKKTEIRFSKEPEWQSFPTESHSLKELIIDSFFKRKKSELLSKKEFSILVNLASKIRPDKIVKKEYDKLTKPEWYSSKAPDVYTETWFIRQWEPIIEIVSEYIALELMKKTNPYFYEKWKKALLQGLSRENELKVAQLYKKYRDSLNLDYTKWRKELLKNTKEELRVKRELNVADYEEWRNAILKSVYGKKGLNYYSPDYKELREEFLLYGVPGESKLLKTSELSELQIIKGERVLESWTDLKKTFRRILGWDETFPSRSILTPDEIQKEIWRLELQRNILLLEERGKVVVPDFVKQLLLNKEFSESLSSKLKKDALFYAQAMRDDWLAKRGRYDITGELEHLKDLRDRGVISDLVMKKRIEDLEKRPKLAKYNFELNDWETSLNLVLKDNDLNKFDEINFSTVPFEIREKKTYIPSKKSEKFDKEWENLLSELSQRKVNSLLTETPENTFQHLVFLGTESKFISPKIKLSDADKEKFISQIELYDKLSKNLFKKEFKELFEKTPKKKGIEDKQRIISFFGDLGVLLDIHKFPTYEEFATYLNKLKKTTETEKQLRKLERKFDKLNDELYRTRNLEKSWYSELEDIQQDIHFERKELEEYRNKNLLEEEEQIFKETLEEKYPPKIKIPSTGERLPEGFSLEDLTLKEEDKFGTEFRHTDAIEYVLHPEKVIKAEERERLQMLSNKIKKLQERKNRIPKMVEKETLKEYQLRISERTSKLDAEIGNIQSEIESLQNIFRIRRAAYEREIATLHSKEYLEKIKKELVEKKKSLKYLEEKEIKLERELNILGDQINELNKQLIRESSSLESLFGVWMGNSKLRLFNRINEKVSLGDLLEQYIKEDDILNNSIQKLKNRIEMVKKEDWLNIYSDLEKDLRSSYSEKNVVLPLDKIKSEASKELSIIKRNPKKYISNLENAIIEQRAQREKLKAFKNIANIFQVARKHNLDFKPKEIWDICISGKISEETRGKIKKTLEYFQKDFEKFSDLYTIVDKKLLKDTLGYWEEIPIYNEKLIIGKSNEELIEMFNVLDKTFGDFKGYNVAFADLDKIMRGAQGLSPKKAKEFIKDQITGYLQDNHVTCIIDLTNSLHNYKFPGKSIHYIPELYNLTKNPEFKNPKHLITKMEFDGMMKLRELFWNNKGVLIVGDRLNAEILVDTFKKLYLTNKEKQFLYEFWRTVRDVSLMSMKSKPGNPMGFAEWTELAKKKFGSWVEKYELSTPIPREEVFKYQIKLLSQTNLIEELKELIRKSSTVKKEVETLDLNQKGLPVLLIAGNKDYLSPAFINKLKKAKLDGSRFVIPQKITSGELSALKIIFEDDPILRNESWFKLYITNKIDPKDRKIIRTQLDNLITTSEFVKRIPIFKKNKEGIIEKLKVVTDLDRIEYREKLDSLIDKLFDNKFKLENLTDDELDAILSFFYLYRRKEGKSEKVTLAYINHLDEDFRNPAIIEKEKERLKRMIIFHSKKELQSRLLNLKGLTDEISIPLEIIFGNDFSRELEWKLRNMFISYLDRNNKVDFVDLNSNFLDLFKNQSGKKVTILKEVKVKVPSISEKKQEFNTKMKANMKMSFDVPCVKNCLLKNGIVYTVRSYHLDGEYYSNVFVKNVGNCKRTLLKEVTRKEDLVDYLKYSGFDSIDDWWKKIGGFTGNRRKWLYKVEKISDEVRSRREWVYKVEKTPTEIKVPFLLLYDKGKLDPMRLQFFRWSKDQNKLFRTRKEILDDIKKGYLEQLLAFQRNPNIYPPDFVRIGIVEGGWSTEYGLQKWVQHNARKQIENIYLKYINEKAPADLEFIYRDQIKLATGRNYLLKEEEKDMKDWIDKILFNLKLHSRDVLKIGQTRRSDKIYEMISKTIDSVEQWNGTHTILGLPVEREFQKFTVKALKTARKFVIKSPYLAHIPLEKFSWLRNLWIEMVLFWRAGWYLWNFLDDEARAIMAGQTLSTTWNVLNAHFTLTVEYIRQLNKTLIGKLEPWNWQKWLDTREKGILGILENRGKESMKKLIFADLPPEKRKLFITTPIGEFLTVSDIEFASAAGLMEISTDPIVKKELLGLMKENTIFDRLNKRFNPFSGVLEADLELYASLTEKVRRAGLFHSLIFERAMTKTKAIQRTKEFLFDYRDITKAGQIFRKFFPFYTFNIKSITLYLKQCKNIRPGVYMAARYLLDEWEEATKDLPDTYKNRIPIPGTGLWILPHFSILQFVEIVRDPIGMMEEFLYNPRRMFLGFGWDPFFSSAIKFVTGKEYWDKPNDLLEKGWTPYEIEEQKKKDKLQKEDSQDIWSILFEFVPLAPLFKALFDADSYIFARQSFVNRKPVREFFKYLGLNVMKYDDFEKAKHIYFDLPPHLRSKWQKDNPYLWNILDEYFAVVKWSKLLKIKDPEEADLELEKLRIDWYVNTYMKLEDQEKGAGERWLEKHPEIKPFVQTFFDSLNYTPWSLAARKERNEAELSSVINEYLKVLPSGLTEEKIQKMKIMGIDIPYPVFSKEKLRNEFYDKAGNLKVSSIQEVNAVLTEKYGLEEVKQDTIENANKRYHDYVVMTNQDKEKKQMEDAIYHFELAEAFALMPENLEELPEDEQQKYWDYFNKFMDSHPETKARYLQELPKASREYNEKMKEYLDMWGSLIIVIENGGDYFGEFYSKPQWFRDLYFLKHPDEKALYPFEQKWIELMKIDELNKQKGIRSNLGWDFFWSDQNKNLRELYFKIHPEKREYYKIWGEIIKATEANPEVFYPLFFQQPKWFQDQFFKENPEKKGYYEFMYKWTEYMKKDEENFKKTGKKTHLASEFFWSDANKSKREMYEKANPGILDYLKRWDTVTRISETEPNSFFEAFYSQPKEFQDRYFASHPNKSLYYPFLKKYADLQKQGKTAEATSYFWSKENEAARQAYEKDNPGVLSYMQFWKKLTYLAEQEQWNLYFQYFYSPENKINRERWYSGDPRREEYMKLNYQYQMMPSITFEDKVKKQVFLKQNPLLTEYWERNLSAEQKAIREKLTQYFDYNLNVPLNGEGKDYLLEVQKWKTAQDHFLIENPEIQIYFNTHSKELTGADRTINQKIAEYNSIEHPYLRQIYLQENPDLQDYFNLSQPPGIRNILKLQKKYYSLPMKERQKFLEQNPILQEYWEISNLPYSYFWDKEEFNKINNTFNTIQKCFNEFKKGNWVKADKLREKLPYVYKNPGDSENEQWLKYKVYSSAMETWSKVSEKNEFIGIWFFRQLPDWIRDRYYSLHPEKKYLSKEPIGRFLEEPLRIWANLNPDLAWAYKQCYKYQENMPYDIEKKVRKIFIDNEVWEDRTKWTRVQWEDYWAKRAIQANEARKFDLERIPLLKSELRKLGRRFPILPYLPSCFKYPRLNIIKPFF